MLEINQMALSEPQNTIMSMFVMLGMTDVKHFVSETETRYVTGVLRGRRYCFSHKQYHYKDREHEGYILSVDDDIRIMTFDPKIIANAMRLLLRNNTAKIPKSIISEIQI